MRERGETKGVRKGIERGREKENERRWGGIGTDAGKKNCKDERVAKNSPDNHGQEKKETITEVGENR